uniref:Uncharacterized protein n=1 Tax=Lygus hesperus TaxID=30085 RepID=A0A0A9Z0E9_LYGHE
MASNRQHHSQCGIPVRVGPRNRRPSEGMPRRGPPRPPPLPRRSSIPVLAGPLRRGHRPLRNPSYCPEPAPQVAPYRMQAVPGRPGRLQRMNPPSFQEQVAQMYPDNPNLSMGELLNLEPGTRPCFRNPDRLAELRNRPGRELVAGERATGFENLVGVDPANPYGEGWVADDFETYGVRDDDPYLFEISSAIPTQPLPFNWEVMEKMQNDMIEAQRLGINYAQQEWRREFADDDYQTDDWGEASAGAACAGGSNASLMNDEFGDDVNWTTAHDFLREDLQADDIGVMDVIDEREEEDCGRNEEQSFRGDMRRRTY